jgi:pyruvate/2-oxoglutarate dehydrogenase complex dihydrolipoamide dehydrogenase (E3) component
MHDSYDIVVIGAGPAGENVADYALRGSNRTALLIENELVGGECSYYACMPSKALLRPVEVRATAENLQGLPDQVDLDPVALLRRRDAWVSGYRDAGQVEWANSAGIDVARGRGRISGPRRVDITSDTGTISVEARHAVVVATGSTPVIPDFLQGLEPWTSRDATGVIEIPESIAVIGGGVVAVEAAHWLAALGSQVTLLVREQRVLTRLEPFAGDFVVDGLRHAGVEVVFDAVISAAQRPTATASGLGRVHGGPVQVTVAGRAREFAEVLAATGRKPASDDIGLAAVGLTPATFADPSVRPAWLYAVGDVSGEAPLTHWGKYRARLIGEQIAARAEGRELPAAPSEVPVPQVVFSDPQVAAVGMTEEAARRAGIATLCPKVPMSSAAGYALLRDDAPGQAQLVIDADTGRLLGATFVGTEVAELVHAATVAIVGGLTISQLWHAVPSYPTSSEVWLRLLDTCR